MTKFFGHPCLRALFCSAQKVEIFVYNCVKVNILYNQIYEWVTFFEGMIYEWVPFFDYQIYEWGKGYVLKYRVARLYQNYLRVNPPRLKLMIWSSKGREEHLKQ